MKEQEIQILDDADLEDIAGGFGGGMGGRLYFLRKFTFGFKYLFGFSPNASGDPRFKRTYYSDLKRMGPKGPISS